jgi:hypothetical protein
VSALEAPLASENVLHVITPLACTPEFVEATYVPPDGSESTSATSAAVEGPALLVVTTYTSVSPATGLAGAASVFVTDRFAAAPTDVDVVLRLFAALGSAADELTRATFAYVPSNGARTRTVSVRLAPLARLNVDHVITPEASEPLFVEETYVPPLGSESTSATSPAVEGPALLVVIT